MNDLVIKQTSNVYKCIIVLLIDNDSFEQWSATVAELEDRAHILYFLISMFFFYDPT